LHRETGFTHLKWDAVKIGSRTGEERLRRLATDIRQRTEDRLLVDLDITAERRPGYFGLPEAPFLFLQNRYTDWGNYFPHMTLRALWSLATVVDPTRLRMEVLNPERNVEAYGDHPLAPARWPADTLLAITLPANPLIWCELQHLPKPVAEAWRALLAAWKPHRNAWTAGDIYPIGDAPDGTTWSGFISHDPETDSGLFIVFRGWNDEPEATLALPVAGEGGVTCIAGNGSGTIAGSTLNVRIEQPLGFLIGHWGQPG
jgi:alpha-galactosidase